MATPATYRLIPRWPVLTAAAILFLAGSAAVFVVRWATAPSTLEANFRRVQAGMTLGEVEAILGPGQQVDSVHVPRHPTGPVVLGDVFYRWTATELYGEEVIVGFKAGWSSRSGITT
jgi:hypothetical protein